MFETAIIDQNPHWTGSLYQTGIPRLALASVREYLKLPHIISLVGVRRCGKSTLARQTINSLITLDAIPPRNILFLNLENPHFSGVHNDVESLEQIYQDYLKLATPQGLVFCVLDEVQFFPQWQIFVKSHYEQKNVKFIVTGSNSRLLSSEFITLLSGRTLPVDLQPFSFAEFLTARGLTAGDAIDIGVHRHTIRNLLDEYLRCGGFPETVFVEGTIKKELLVMYARSILYQDIAPRFGVKKPDGMEKLLYYLMSNVSSLVSCNKLAGLLGLSDKTIKEYLSYFADAHLLYSMDAYSFSVKKQINSPKKTYACDTGMAEATGFRFSGNEGHLLENLVYLELRRQGKSISYYTTSNGLQVDFAVHDHSGITALYQVAWELTAESTRIREIRALKKAMDETGLNSGTIVSYETEETIEEQGKQIRIVPAYQFLLEQVRGDSKD